MRHVRGFSLVEVLVVTAIVGLLATASTAVYIEHKEATALESVEQEVALLWREAALRARTGQLDTSWSVARTPHAVVLFAGTDLAARDEALDVTVDIPSGVELVGPALITFAGVTGYPLVPATYEFTGSAATSSLSINEYGTIIR